MRNAPLSSPSMAPPTGDAKRPARTAGRPLGIAGFGEVFKMNPVDGMSLPFDEMETLTWEGLPTS